MSGFLGTVIFDEILASDPGTGNYHPVDLGGYGAGGQFSTTFSHTGLSIFFPIPIAAQTGHTSPILNPIGAAVGVVIFNGECRTNNIIVNASGGVAPYSYFWTAPPESDITIDFPNSNNTSFRKRMDAPSGETWSVTCTITDSIGQTAYNVFPVSFNAVLPEGGSPE